MNEHNQKIVVDDNDWGDDWATDEEASRNDEDASKNKSQPVEEKSPEHAPANGDDWGDGWGTDEEASNNGEEEAPPKESQPVEEKSPEPVSSNDNDGWGDGWGGDDGSETQGESDESSQTASNETTPEENSTDTQSDWGGSWGSASSGAADIAILLDVTGSMKPCIDALRRSIRDFLEALANGDEDCAPVEDWRVRLVGYRDYDYDSNMNYGWLVDSGFTRNISEIEEQLDTMKARGGGDDPESLLDAIQLVLDDGIMEAEHAKALEDNKKWRPKSQAAHILVVFTDASFHERMSIPGHEGEDFDTLAERIIDFGMHGFVYVPEMEQYADTFSDLPRFIVTGCGEGADGLGSVLSDPVHLRDILLRLQRGISRSASSY